MRRNVKRILYDIAEDQMGYVTSAQAREAGVHPALLVQLANRDWLTRTSHGVYRLVDFPVHRHLQYMEATFWPYRRRGVISHHTALYLYEVCDILPNKVHITLPPGYRVQRPPLNYLVIHHADHAPGDVESFGGFPITTPVRTIRDCIAVHIGPALVEPAIDTMRRTAMIRKEMAEQLQRELDAALNAAARAA